MKKILTLFFLVLPFFAFSQEFAYGFKAGLNFSSFIGPSEENVDESYESVTGFHVGAGVVYKVTDLWGLKGELIFSQKGTRYRFDGPSYIILEAESGDLVPFLGIRNTSISYSNSYIDLPIMAYGKYGRLEFSGGVNVGFLVASLGSGELDFDNGVSLNGRPIDDFILTLDHNSFKDEPRGLGEDDNGQTSTRQVGNDLFELPNAIGAYYFFEEDPGNLFNIVDLGLNVGLSFYFNSALYFGARLNYGLLDVTNNDADRQRSNLDSNGNYILRDDIDQNLSIQTSIGFSF